MRDTAFYAALGDRVGALGGYHNAHLHLDRSHTLRLEQQNGHLSLQQKHGLISQVHAGPFYRDDCLTERLNRSLDQMVACNTRQADSVIDVTADGLGLRALEVANRVKVERAPEIAFRTAAYSPLGFRDDAPERWSLFEEGAKTADLIGCLPERDDRTDYPDHIGYEESCRRMLDLAQRRGVEVQVHVDQANHPNEDGTERLLEVIEADGFVLGTAQTPKVWAVHMISPSCYAQPRWEALVHRLKAANVGVICCPSAALGMRQLRGVMTPTGNSIARVLDLCAAGIPVRLGSDNLADMLSPSTTADLGDEVFVLSAALRFYDIEILAKLACGRVLDAAEVNRVAEHLEQDNVAAAEAIRRWGPIQ